MSTKNVNELIEENKLLGDLLHQSSIWLGNFLDENYDADLDSFCTSVHKTLGTEDFRELLKEIRVLQKNKIRGRQ